MGKFNRGEMFLGVLEDLRERIAAMEKRIRLGLPATEDTDDKDPDPMDEMGDFDIPDLHDNQPKRKNKRPPFESQVCRIAMPDLPEEAMTGGALKKRQVCILRGEWKALDP